MEKKEKRFRVIFICTFLILHIFNFPIFFQWTWEQKLCFQSGNKTFRIKLDTMTFQNFIVFSSQPNRNSVFSYKRGDLWVRDKVYYLHQKKYTVLSLSPISHSVPWWGWFTGKEAQVSQILTCHRGYWQTCPDLPILFSREREITVLPLNISQGSYCLYLPVLRHVHRLSLEEFPISISPKLVCLHKCSWKDSYRGILSLNLRTCRNTTDLWWIDWQ